MSRNDEVAALLEEFADLLAATGVEYNGDGTPHFHMLYVSLIVFKCWGVRLLL